MIILGIETSCDETAAAVVTNNREILSNIILSQIDIHRPYGGVVPEIAARGHINHLSNIIKEALSIAGINKHNLSAIAVTAGPGLIGGVIVGLTTAKAMALACNKPLIAINHLEGHALTPRLSNNISFPYLLLLMSGGHCQLLLVSGVGQYKCLGTTLDDAIGEAFDKTAKLLGLSYPGGPALEQLALYGNPNSFNLPKPMVGRPGCNFSFSGLKTAIRDLITSFSGPINDYIKADIAASFQKTIITILINRVKNALTLAPLMPLVVAGGVAANKSIRNNLQALAFDNGRDFIAPPINLCPDNGAMIAWAGIEHYRLGMSDNIAVAPKARWPLDPTISDLIRE